MALRAAGALVAVLIIVALGQRTEGARASVAVGQPPPLSARAWFLVDARDGARLAGQDVATPAAIASTTKLMTAYLAFDELRLDERLVASPYDALPSESLLGLQAGERISVRDLLYGLLLASGNDAAVTLADGVAGSVPAFVDEMNRAAGDLGLRDTSYSNPIGLDEPGNYSSPRDLAKLTMRLRRQRLFRRVFDTARATLQTGAQPRTIVNRNQLVLAVPWIDGVKTGYTLDAGNVLIGSGTRKGVTLLSVVLGAPSEAARDQDTLSLLRYGFSLYLRRTPVSIGETLAAPSVLGRDESCPWSRPVPCGWRPGETNPFGWRLTLRARWRGQSRAVDGSGPALSPWTAMSWGASRCSASARPSHRPATRWLRVWTTRSPGREPSLGSPPEPRSSRS